MPHISSAYDHDLVIVGASVAGAACALAAAQYGLRVCVLERKADPGERLHTTGIVVKEAMEQTWLGHMPEHLVQRVARVRLYAPNLRSVHLAAPGYYFLTTDTPNLRVAPTFRRKRLLRWAMDHLQQDWPLNALLRAAVTRRVAEQIYFHRRGVRA